MVIRSSTEQDFDRMMEIYSFARRFMAEHGNPNQWGPTNWPPEELIHHDIRSGNSYVCVNDEGKVVGTFFFVHGKDIELVYRIITDGSWLDDSPYGVVHRLASDGSRKGVGSFCLNWAYEQCGHLRIDTHGDNRVMQNLVRKEGFVHCGTIYVEEDDYPRMAYEKSMKTAWMNTDEWQMKPSIRVMTIDDYEKVYALWMSCKNMGFNDVDDSREGIAKYLKRNPSTCFIAEKGESVVGVILSGHDGRRGFIHHMAVAEDCRRQHIATDLLEHAVSALKAEGINKIALLVFNRNEAGNAFWESQGFTARTDITYRNKALVELIRIDT